MPLPASFSPLSLLSANLLSRAAAELSVCGLMGELCGTCRVQYAVRTAGLSSADSANQLLLQRCLLASLVGSELAWHTHEPILRRYGCFSSWRPSQTANQQNLSSAHVLRLIQSDLI